MRIDVVIANPPYSGSYDHLCKNIIDKLKEIKPSRYISVHPMYSYQTYKTAEFVRNPFGIRWSNIFVYDMMGNENDFFSKKKAPIWNKQSEDIIYVKGEQENTKVYIRKIQDKEKQINSVWNRVRVTNDETTRKFVDWLNTNEEAKFRLGFIRTRHISILLYNRLWEIYNENRHSDCESTI